ncbi:guanylate kinase [Candidatus Dependentiae bacterium]|nr:guanylate kinase [Candidatus Dependentiae bacterium]
MRGKLFIVSAPSGAGKTTLVNALLKNWSAACSLARVVTYTTKSPRKNEIPGKDYHFVSQDKFQELISMDFFLEWNSFCGNYYGTPRHILTECDQGNSLILVIDRVGARRIIANVPDAYSIVTVWIQVSSLAVLRERLCLRGTEKHEQIQSRLERACVELSDEQQNKLYRYHVINDDFSRALGCLQSIFLEELAVF